MNNNENSEKVRIYSQIGRIPELFYESIGEIPELVRGYIHYGQLLKFGESMNKLKRSLCKVVLINLFRLFIFSLFLSINFGCSSNYRTFITDPNANMQSSLEELTNKQNDKSPIIKELESKIANMELFNVVDFTKRYLTGPDLGCGIFYDLKNEGEKGSGNIYIYKRSNLNIQNGISNETLEELKVEQQDIENRKIAEFNPSILEIDGMQFYKSVFVTPPDGKNDKYDCHLYITGFNKNYVKIIFYYSEGSVYCNQESELFIKTLSSKLKNVKSK